MVFISKVVKFIAVASKSWMDFEGGRTEEFFFIEEVTTVNVFRNSIFNFFGEKPFIAGPH